MSANRKSARRVSDSGYPLIEHHSDALDIQRFVRTTLLRGEARLLHLAAILLLHMTLRIIETNVHGFAIGPDRPTGDLHHLAALLI